MSHLDHLEAESISILREVATTMENPVMMYSIGKDSSVMLHLARKAFHPSPIPFPLLHVDTRWKFGEMIKLRDKFTKKHNLKLLVHTNPDAIKHDINPFTHGSEKHTHITKTLGLKQALNKYKFDAVIGGARRDEEKSRAKERIFSFRDKHHKWDPKNQRPEPWNIFNTKIDQGESIRVFPLSNWTELDIWLYIKRENIEIVPLYFADKRPFVIRNDTMIMVDDDRFVFEKGEKVQHDYIRFRTLGCYPLTGAMKSKATTLDEVIQETLLSTNSEREGRLIDSDSSNSMEKKKAEGYF